MLQKNYLNLLLSILIFGLFQYQYAQAPDTLWTKTFGGIVYDEGRSVQQTTDGGYIIAGRTVSFGAGGYDVWLIKTDDSGNTDWTKTFGGIGDDYGESVQQTADGGYIITGMTESFGAGDFDVWLIKTNTSGDTLWTKTFGGSEWDLGYSVRQTAGGGYIIAGVTRSFGAGEIDVWLIKTDASGDSLWAKTFGGSNLDCGNSVQQTTGGGYIITGYTESFGAGEGDVWLIKTDASGGAVWSKTFGGSSRDEGSSVQQTDDGGYIIAGWTSSFGPGNGAVYLIKTNSSGDTSWTNAIGRGSWDEGSTVQQTTDGGYIITGMTRAVGTGDFDVLLVKTNNLGDTLWTKIFGGFPFDDDDVGYSVQQTTDGGYIIAGVTESFGAGASDVWLIKTDSDPSDVIQDEQTTIPSTFILNQNYPNPFNPSTNIKFSLPVISSVTLKVYDVLGSEIVELVNGRMEAGIHEFQFNSSSLTSGVYFYKLEAQEVNGKINFVDVGKMMLIK